MNNLFSKWKVQSVLFLLIGTIFSVYSQSDYVAEENSVNKISHAIQSYWNDHKCADEISHYSGYQMISIACVGDFTSDIRQKILDQFFSANLVLRKESYQLEKNAGLYLYKLERKAPEKETLFVKIYVRDSRILWPVHERTKPQVAIYVENMMSEEELISWQTLGIPLTYGVVPGRSTTGPLLKKIKQYGQESWLVLTLESNLAEQSDFKILTREEARDIQKLGPYIEKIIPEGSEITGISSREGSLFMNDIISLRNLFSELRKSGVHYFLDTLVLEKSGGFDTAKIMSLNAFRSNITFPTEMDRMQAAWETSILRARRTGMLIMVVDHDSETGRRYIQSQIQQLLPFIEFSHISELPYKN